MCTYCDYGMSYADPCEPGEHDYDDDGDCVACGAEQSNDEFLARVEEGK